MTAPPAEAQAKAPFWRWLVLLAFCFNSACNAFMFMNFATVSDQAKEAFDGIGDSKLNWLYSASLLSVLPVAFPMSYLLNSHNRLATGFGVVMNVVAAWMRYVSVQQRDYSIALASSVALGLSASVVITSVAHVPESWFPKAEKNFAMGIAVQANYAGWCLGAVVTPYVVTSSGDFGLYLFSQAVVVSGALVLFMKYHKVASPTSPKTVCADELNRGFVEEFRLVFVALGKSRTFLHQMVATSILGGISFAIPAVQEELFDTFSTRSSAWTNCSFILSGVLGGLYFGTYRQEVLNKLLTACYAVCAVSLSVMVVFARLESHFSYDVFYGIMIGLMAVSGLTSLGFMGSALSKACHVVHPISHTWSGGAIEWWVQVWGAALTQVSVNSVGFIACAGCAWLALLVFVTRPKDQYSEIPDSEGDSPSAIQQA